MFSEGQIIYFSPFYFKNGNTAKNKYFIVIKNVENEVIIASLPTRLNKIPSFVTVPHGCVNHNERCFNCYLFEAGRKITDNGFCFDLPTFIYGDEIEDYKLETLNSVYGMEGVDYEIMGTLLNEEYNALLECIRNSTSVKRKIKRLIGP